VKEFLTFGPMPKGWNTTDVTTAVRKMMKEVPDVPADQQWCKISPMGERGLYQMEVSDVHVKRKVLDHWHTTDWMKWPDDQKKMHTLPMNTKKGSHEAAVKADLKRMSGAWDHMDHQANKEWKARAEMNGRGGAVVLTPKDTNGQPKKDCRKEEKVELCYYDHHREKTAYSVETEKVWNPDQWEALQKKLSAKYEEFMRSNQPKGGKGKGKGKSKGKGK